MFTVKKRKVLYGQESPRGKSTTAVCEVNYQLRTDSNATDVAQWATPS